MHSRNVSPSKRSGEKLSKALTGARDSAIENYERECATYAATPRTDAIVAERLTEQERTIAPVKMLALLARQLERELAEARCALADVQAGGNAPSTQRERELLRRVYNDLLPPVAEDGWTAEDEQEGRTLMAEIGSYLGIEPPSTRTEKR